MGKTSYLTNPYISCEVWGPLPALASMNAYKKTAVSALFALTFISWLQANEPPVPPPASMPLEKAAAIAQNKLTEMKLPPEYFLRSVVYSPASEKEPVACYIASYEPTKRRTLRVKRDEPIPEPEPIKLSFIQVFMDGTTAIIEKEAGVPRKPKNP